MANISNGGREILKIFKCRFWKNCNGYEESSYTCNKDSGPYRGKYRDHSLNEKIDKLTLSLAQKKNPIDQTIIEKEISILLDYKITLQKGERYSHLLD